MNPIGVALSSGGAATMAHVGVLLELAEAGVRVGTVAGASGGAMVGAALAAGNLEAFARAMSGLSRRRVLSLFDPRWPRLGMLEGRRAMDLVRPHVGGRIEDLPLPFAAVATDLDRGERVVIREGDVLAAIRASIAVPGILTPTLMGNRMLVDGALSDPIPVAVARELGAPFVLAVNVLPLAEDVLRRARPPGWSARELATRAWESLAPLFEGSPRAVLARAAAAQGDAVDEPLDSEERRGLVDVILRASHIAQCHIAALGLQSAPPDHLLTVPVPAVGLFDFHRTPELIELGRETARREMPTILAALRRAEPVVDRISRWLSGPERSDGEDRAVGSDLRGAPAGPTPAAPAASGESGERAPSEGSGEDRREPV